MKRHLTNSTWFLASVAAMLLGFTGMVQATTEVYRNALRSTFWICTKTGSGSGVLVDREKRLAITNYHVVRGQSEVLVFSPFFQETLLVTRRQDYLANARHLVIRARVVARDSKRDLALLELERVPDRVQPLPLAPASAQPGQNVHTIGNPGSSGALWIYTFGTVRQVYRKKFLTSAPGESPFEVEACVIETQCPTNPGDSGGPIVNDEGQLVGITQGADTEARLVSFGIDIAEIKALIKEGPKLAGDRRLKECLDKAGLKYRTSASGLFEVSAAEEDKNAHPVYITSRTRKVAGLEIREVYASALQLKEKPAEGLAQQLLQKNSQETLGNWQLVKAKNGQYKVLFCVPMAADAEPECLRQVVLLVRNRAADLKKECETQPEP